MEMLKTSEDVERLKELNGQLEKDLRMLNICIEHLPEHLRQQLEHLANVHLLTGLSEMNEFTLAEFYINKKKNHLDQRLASLQFKHEINDLKKRQEMNSKECELFEKFINNNKTATKKADSEEAISLLKKKLQTLQQQHERFKVPKDVNIEEIIKKIKKLEQRDA